MSDVDVLVVVYYESRNLYACSWSIHVFVLI